MRVKLKTINIIQTLTRELQKKDKNTVYVYKELNIKSQFPCLYVRVIPNNSNESLFTLFYLQLNGFHKMSPFNFAIHRIPSYSIAYKHTL